jgi:hypothetical protein
MSLVHLIIFLQNVFRSYAPSFSYIPFKVISLNKLACIILHEIIMYYQLWICIAPPQVSLNAQYPLDFLVMALIPLGLKRHATTMACQLTHFMEQCPPWEANSTLI